METPWRAIRHDLRKIDTKRVNGGISNKAPPKVQDNLKIMNFAFNQRIRIDSNFIRIINHYTWLLKWHI